MRWELMAKKGGDNDSTPLQKPMKRKSYQPPYTIPEVLQMRSQGKTYSEIGNHFGVSSSRVGQIINREKQQRQSGEHRKVILNGIHNDNDIELAIPVENMLCVLNLSAKAKTCLKRYFEAKKITELSLRDMMDVLLPVVDVDAGYMDHLPGYRVKGLGTIIYTELVQGLSAVDKGETFQREWTKRKGLLREYIARNGETYCQTERWAKALA